MNSVLNFLVVFFIGACQSVPISDSKSRLIRYEDDRNLDTYKYGFETDNGISRNEVAEIKVKDNKEILTVSGSYAFTGDDGKRYIVIYTSDENGYLPLIHNMEEVATLPPRKNVPSLGIPPAALASLAGGGLG
ncbi:endocuticle structural glycoprotein ABD-5-like [Euwallacea similis]|uniref:endocuticle structural glycoprotein ABD-5-like n=1 Tax=Euwallacea similis TaxID=1736056 RepID=UPI00344BAB24